MMVPGMTPYTVPWDLALATTNVEYQIELDGKIYQVLKFGIFMLKKTFQRLGSYSSSSDDSTEYDPCCRYHG